MMSEDINIILRPRFGRSPEPKKRFEDFIYSRALDSANTRAREGLRETLPGGGGGICI
jgi:hypothetical protein